MSLNKFRYYSFWFLDSLKGGTIRKHFNQIKQTIEQPNSTITIEQKKSQLNALLKHAIETTPYYSEFNIKNTISEFPVVRKTIIQDNFERFRSLKFKDQNNFKVSTSGSTGVPFFLFQNKGKRQRNHADVIYFFDQAGFEIGNRLYELEVWRRHNKKGNLKSKIQNVVQFDISKLSDDRILEFIKLIETDKESNKTMLGFASAYEMISSVFRKA